MAEHIYKYFPKESLELVFARKGFCGVKCSLPKDYNDPFELFLGVGLNIGPQALAIYRDIVQDIPQYPTTCFSHSPVVTPMWAHYAQNHSGFVVEFDVDKLRESFPEVGFHDVEYMDVADSSIEHMIARVATTLKPRHAVWLRDAVLARSYFSKHTAWSYEDEIRLVSSDGETEDVNGLSILFIPLECLTSIVVGKNFPDEMVETSQAIAESAGIDWFRELIGKSHPQPYFANADGEIFVHDGSGIYGATQKCPACDEPIVSEAELCPWCAITDDDRFQAARSNPFRMLDSAGALEGYMKGVAEIKKSLK